MHSFFFRKSKVKDFSIVWHIAFIFLIGCTSSNTPTSIFQSSDEITKTPEKKILPTNTKVVSEVEDILIPTEADIYPDKEASLPPTDTPTTVKITPTPAKFSIDKANKVKPSDVVKEVGYFEKGGGPECGNVPISTNGLYEELTPEDGYLMDAALLLVCGWRENENIEVIVRFPNGYEIKEELTAKSSMGGRPEILYWFIPQINDPVGTYTFTLSGLQKTVTYKASYKKPIGTYVFPILSGSEQTWWEVTINTVNPANLSRLMLYGFEPNENIRLLAYVSENSSNYNFFAWQEFKVDPSGQLFIDIDLPTEYARITIIGDSSGEYPLLLYTPFGKLYADSTSILSSDQELSNQSSSCPGAPPQQVRVDEQAQVCTKTDYLIVREQPKRNSNVIDRIPPGTIMKIKDGPVCSDNWSWWKIRTTDDLVGWVSEGGDNIDPYFICPVK